MSRKLLYRKDIFLNFRIDMYFEGTRDAYGPLMGMLFMGSEQDCLDKAAPGIDKKLPIFEKV